MQSKASFANSQQGCSEHWRFELLPVAPGGRPRTNAPKLQEADGSFTERRTCEIQTENAQVCHRGRELPETESV